MQNHLTIEDAEGLVREAMEDSNRTLPEEVVKANMTIFSFLKAEMLAEADETEIAAIHAFFDKNGLSAKDINEYYDDLQLKFCQNVGDQDRPLYTIASFAGKLLADFLKEREMSQSELVSMRSDKSALVAAFMDVSFDLYQLRSVYPTAVKDFEAHFNKRFNISDVSEIA